MFSSLTVSSFFLFPLPPFRSACRFVCEWPPLLLSRLEQGLLVTTLAESLPPDCTLLLPSPRRVSLRWVEVLTPCWLHDCQEDLLVPTCAIHVVRELVTFLSRERRTITPTNRFSLIFRDFHSSWGKKCPLFLGSLPFRSVAADLDAGTSSETTTTMAYFVDEQHYLPSLTSSLAYCCCSIRT